MALHLTWLGASATTPGMRAPSWMFSVLVSATLWSSGVAIPFGEAQLLLAPTVLSPGADGIQRTTVMLDSYSFSPQALVVTAGVPVELTLTSVTTIIPHNFVIQEPAGGMTVSQDVGAGKTVTVRFTPTQPGKYAFFCDKKLFFMKSHREKGMEGTLEVR